MPGTRPRGRPRSCSYPFTLTTPDTQHPTSDTLLPTPDTRHPTPYIRHPTPDTRHPTPYTPHPTLTPDSRLPTPDTLQDNAWHTPEGSPSVLFLTLHSKLQPLNPKP